MKLDLKNKETILVGDFNCDWNMLMHNNVAPRTLRLANLSTTFQFEQFVKELPRVTVVSRTLIDLAFCSRSELFNQKFRCSLPWHKLS